MGALRSIAAVSVARSDFGLYEPLLEVLRKDPAVELRLMPGGTHFDPRFGPTIREIEALGYQYEHGLGFTLADDNAAAMARALGAGVSAYAEAFARRRPDLVLVLGDRLEMLCGAVAALPFGIPIAHLYGGKVTEGAVDELVRHALTKMSHLHFVTCELHERRLHQMGEEAWRVHNFGSPGLDRILATPRGTREEVSCKFGLDPARPYIIVTFHPVTLEAAGRTRQIGALMEALAGYGGQFVISYPNADIGHREVIAAIERFAAARPADAKIVRNAGSRDFFDLMAHAAAMIGNSSSAIGEAPSFALPAVNIGTRQAGFQRAGNVIDCGNDAREIAAAIGRATSPEFRAGLHGLKNPYGDGTASPRIAAVLRSVPLDDRLLRKRFVDLPRAQ
jgi:UDP-hydrolysing UDP-N-acetyl-D-glucosamine 2-epimerase